MMLKKIKVALGIITRKVFTGPLEVSVDLTRKCNLNCLMCWWWSPLLEKRPSPEWANQELDYELFRQLIQDLKKLQVKRVILGGQGEPFLYPKLLEAIAVTKQAGIEVALITCGVYFNQKKIKAIFDLGIDCLDVSLQAATAETYLKIHPGQKEEAFNKIKEWLTFVSSLKQSFKRTTPKIKLIHIICSLNYQETVKMVTLAKELGADSIGFKRVDVTAQTKGLLLNEGQLRELKSLLDETKTKAKELRIEATIDVYRKYILPGLTTGDYTSSFYSRIPCYTPWRSARILADGNVIPCCGCYDVILGNIYHTSFIDIWHSKQYRRFRQQAIGISKKALLKEGCKCYSCVDYSSNLGVYRKLHPFKAKDETAI